MVAVIPVRSLRDGKTRLAAVLSPDERQALIERMLGVVVAAARAAPRAIEVAVVTPDPDAAAFAAALAPDILTLAQDAHRPGLNAAVAIGRDWAVTRGADRLATLSADLPLLTADDVARLAAEDADLVVARDRRGEGTNGLTLRLDGRGRAFRFAFGEASAGKHAAEARRLGLSLRCLDLRGTAFDLDEPDDLVALAGHSFDPATVLARPLAPCGVGAKR
jgi:2-phospho-L-lactate/phosphoenolpyruvate guanylyltransferase